ncbi:MAG: PcfJ domain-containing protein [Streptococcus sp.]
MKIETAKRLTNMMKAQTAFDKYAFIFPKDESEIVKEGKTLHHCVGSYAKTLCLRNFYYCLCS